MLIIAQPKSASTSLLYTLSKMLKGKAVHGTKRKAYDILNPGFERLQYFHTLIFERTALDVKNMIEMKKTVYREHLLPTERNLRILDKYNNYIVLLRNPEDSYDNYVRIMGKEDKKLLKELKDFNSKYRKYLEDKNILIVNYEDLVLDYVNTIIKIKRYWKINSKIRLLEKLNYTGEGEKKLNAQRDA
jgi:hypothetical protein